MRFATTFSVLLVSMSAYCQEIIIASNRSPEPLNLLKQAHSSLGEGNVRLAINIFEKVISFYENEGRQKELAENYLGMALAFALNGNYDESIQFHKKALRAHKKYKSNESADEILTNLGLAYHLAGKVKKARKYLN